MLKLIDGFIPEPHSPPAIPIDRRLRPMDVIDLPSGQFILRGHPDHVRSANGPKLVV